MRAYYEYEVMARPYRKRHDAKRGRFAFKDKVEARSRFDAELEFHKLYPKTKIISVVRGKKLVRHG